MTKYLNNIIIDSFKKICKVKEVTTDEDLLNDLVEWNAYIPKYKVPGKDNWEKILYLINKMDINAVKNFIKDQDWKWFFNGLKLKPNWKEFIDYSCCIKESNRTIKENYFPY